MAVPFPQILLYGPIWEYKAETFVQQVQEYEGEVLEVALNTPGGSPEYMFSMVRAFDRFEGTKRVEAQGKVYSGGFFFCCYADEVVALDTAQFMVHRAAYPAWLERDEELFTEFRKKNLADINKALETAFRNRVDVAKFESITGKRIKDIFSMDDRIDVPMNAKQAKQCGLVDSVVRITPKKRTQMKAALDEAVQDAAAMYNGDFDFLEIPPASNDDDSENINTNENDDNMSQLTAEEIQSKYPQAYNAIFALGTAAGVKQESDRIAAWNAWYDVDSKAVTEGIKSGEEISQPQVMELMRKSTMKAAGKTLEDENADTPEVESDEERRTNLKKAGEDLDAKLDKEMEALMPGAES